MRVLNLFFSLLISLAIFSWPTLSAGASKVVLGIDSLFNGEYDALLKGKRVGLITNHTGVNGQLISTIDVFKNRAKEKGYQLVALFAPEHGLFGGGYASESIGNSRDASGIPIYSLHGDTRRPTAEMLKGIDLLVYDIQDIGSRSYTYISTLFYAMEEAAKKGITVVVADRPNPINGITVDGPMLEKKWRSFVGYVAVPYCHGMTVGELARYFNKEYKVGCDLKVIPMKGWQRRMSFRDTGLTWIPTSPYVPEADTPMYYPTTGILGELQLVNIGIGYTLPFKVIGAPWVDGKKLARHLNAQNLPGVFFQPFYYRPFYGRFAQEDCQGVLIAITDAKTYLPVTTQYLLMGMLKNLYPNQFEKALASANDKKEMFCKVNGTEKVLELLNQKQLAIGALRSLHQNERKAFAEVRLKYLLPEYAN